MSYGKQSVMNKRKQQLDQDLQKITTDLPINERTERLRNICTSLDGKIKQKEGLVRAGKSENYEEISNMYVQSIKSKFAALEKLVDN